MYFKFFKFNLSFNHFLIPMPKIGLKEWFHSWSISKKFSLTYLFAIGIALGGSSGGLIWGEFYEQQAIEMVQRADLQEKLLKQLKLTGIQLRSHPQMLLPVLGKEISFEYEKYRFLGYRDEAEKYLEELEDFLQKYPNFTATDLQRFKTFLRDYQKQVKTYNDLVEELWVSVQLSSLTPTKIPQAEQRILNFIKGQETQKNHLEFEQLSEDLLKLLSIAEQQKYAANRQLNQIQKTRIKILIWSMLVSVILASLLAYYTVWNISLPLKKMTEIAKTVTEKSNFKLQVPVTTSDEVGTLALSFNHLIQTVGDYTKKLEISRQTLEQKVQERTQELSQALEELRQTQSQLIQSEKMSSLGQIVAGIAHEINNPVNFIHGNLEHAKKYTQELLNLLQLYQQEHPESPGIIQDYLDEIDWNFFKDDLPKLMQSMTIGTERIRSIVLSLRNFSRLDESEKKKVNIHEGIDSTLLILNSRFKTGVKVIKQYGDIPEIECYPAQLNQVFLNLLTNALDALEEQQSCPNTPEVIIQTQKLDSNRIEVRIRDNGIGIPLDIQPKIFDPFFTTKPVGKGTGLGLSICYQIINKHQGKIKLISQQNQGTEFIISLPISREF